MTPTQIIFIIVSTLTTVASIYIGIHTFQHFYGSVTIGNHASANSTDRVISAHDHTNSKEYTFFKNAMLICFAFFSVQIIVCNLDHLISAVLPQDPFYELASICIWTGYFVGNIVLLLIFIQRLKYTFHNTSFECTKCA
eukprot:275175_1